MLTPMSFGMPELLIYVVPAFAGIIGSRYLTRLANFCLMVVVFQFDLAVLLGQLKAAVFTPYTVICMRHIGCNNSSRLSNGSLT